MMRNAVSLLRRSIGPLVVLLTGCGSEKAVQPEPNAESLDPAFIVMVSGNEQTGTTGASLSKPFVVRVTTAKGRGLDSIPVVWNVTSGEGYICFSVPDECHLSGHPVYTDANGYSQVWFRPARPGTSTVAAVLAGVANSPVSFTATATPFEDVPSVSASGRLAFSSWNTSVSHIYTMKPEGSDLMRLVEGEDPAWSPDGRRIVFWRRPTRPSGTAPGTLFVMNADGSNVRSLGIAGYQPTWSPDGQKIAFGCSGICVINADGSGHAVLAHTERPWQATDICIEDSAPAWSPDGTTIAFTRWVSGTLRDCLSLGVIMAFPMDFWPELWLVDADASNVRELRTPEGWSLAAASWPSWSPDGRRIAFHGADYSNSGIYVINRDGSGLDSVWTRHGAWGPNEGYGGPAWSPDGRDIVVPELYPDPDNPPGRYRVFSADGLRTKRTVNSSFQFSLGWVVWRWSK